MSKQYAKLNNSGNVVTFEYKHGQYDNFIDFLNEHKIAFMTEVDIDFTNIPISLHGRGDSNNLLEYIANNNSDVNLIKSFIDYFIKEICDIRLTTGEKISFNIHNSSTWQNATFFANTMTYIPVEWYTINNYVENDYVENYFV
jgi:hypothetical protein